MDAAAVDLGWVLAAALAAVLAALEIAKKSLGYLGPLVAAWLKQRRGHPEPDPAVYTGPERRKNAFGASPELVAQLMEQHREIIREQRLLNEAITSTVSQLQQGRERDGEMTEALKALSEAMRALRQESAVAAAETDTKLNFLVAATGR